MSNFHWITPNIAQGAYPDPPLSAFQHADVVVFCAEELQPKIKAPPGKQIVKIGFDDDFYRPIPPEAGQIFHAHGKLLGKLALNGKKVLITCAMGINRSGLMTALTLMHGYRMNPSDAIKLIRARRSPECLANPMFVQWLLNQR